MSIDIFAFYNNKGGVGKTTLCQNAACLYAEKNPGELVLVIDLCPQANVSQFLLGGGHKGYAANQRLQTHSSRKNIVGFMDWLLAGNSGFTSLPSSYMTAPGTINSYVPPNLRLIAGDSFLESLTLALNFATMNPANIYAWREYVTAIRRLCSLELVMTEYKSAKVFIDCNPSFSIYTQMALVSANYLIIPVMADFSSLEGIKGILMLLYGKYPSAATLTYANKVVTFNRQIQQFGLKLPRIYELVFNNYTVNSGVATAYDSVRQELIKYSYDQYVADSSLFAACNDPITDQEDWEEYYISNVKDFHTSGKVSASLGIPLHRLPEKTDYVMPNGEEVNLPKKNYSLALSNLEEFVSKIN
ncbi:ParA family protein [Xanthomonas campestris pv. raphani]|uniref:ParA family protein n=1 Tax=Xanthomonas campestris TaxID=339 RepID=UPI002368C6C4|nr:ParA family protein [Xanthomonas campestris]MEA9824581.1 ParA family protein [Xanthomonas campestris pv. raphani]MEA9852997.1 ParA family protein [Xanthomonas campestris pv. raphani]MEA9856891.1 ParA family protein [Xanthomonas campestris pv. raphani]MEA9966033.1 ParA family protein [Xanthomonas campestris pv. raphani]WDJ22018.1 AAA family ATPase [Xanthomonas campestris pv. raphani]